MTAPTCYVCRLCAADGLPMPATVEAIDTHGNRFPACDTCADLGSTVACRPLEA